MTIVLMLNGSLPRFYCFLILVVVVVNVVVVVVVLFLRYGMNWRFLNED